MQILLAQHARLLVNAGEVKVAGFRYRCTQDELFELAAPEELGWELYTPESFEEVFPLEDGKIGLYDSVYRLDLEELVPSRFYECGRFKRSFGTAIILNGERIYEVMFQGAGLDDVALVTLQAQDIMDNLLAHVYAVNGDSGIISAEYVAPL